jgi:hypothetical protein
LLELLAALSLTAGKGSVALAAALRFRRLKPLKALQHRFAALQPTLGRTWQLPAAGAQTTTEQPQAGSSGANTEHRGQRALQTFQQQQATTRRSRPRPETA